MALVEVDRPGAVATIRFGRSEDLCALDLAHAEALLAALESVGRDPAVRAVVLTGSGRAFCAGGDLKWMRAFGGADSGEPMRQLTKPFHAAAVEMRRMPKPVVAAVNGVAAGGGFSLALSADFRVAAPRAKFRVAYANVGLTPDGGLTWLLPRIVGRQQAARLTLRDTVVDAAEALRIGLVDEVTDDGACLDVALAWAAEMAARPGGAVGASKRLLDAGWGAGFESHLEAEREAHVAAGRSEAHRKALDAFLDQAPKPGAAG